MTVVAWLNKFLFRCRDLKKSQRKERKPLPFRRKIRKEWMTFLIYSCSYVTPLISLLVSSLMTKFQLMKKGTKGRIHHHQSWDGSAQEVGGLHSIHFQMPWTAFTFINKTIVSRPFHFFGARSFFTCFDDTKRFLASIIESKEQQLQLLHFYISADMTF